MQMLRDHEVKANLVIPIFQNKQIWGFLIAQECAQPRQWQQEEIDLLQKLSEQVAIAIEQAELYQQSQTELVQREKLATQLRHKAMHDGLTQLPNRNLLEDRLNYIFQIYRQDGKQDQSCFALLFLDLNDFKAINDTLGHDAGDQVLIVVAKRLQGCLREKDTVSRLGGDEFVVILEGIHSKEDAIDVANRIHEAFAPPTEVHGEQIRLSTSIGIVMHDRRYVDATQMLRDADAAMYEAKQNELPYVVFNESA
jgi:diguanylate cyclase (GGDEF)-like protein